MEQKTLQSMIKDILLGKRYSRITDVNDKARYMTMTLIFTIVMVPLFMFGISAMGDDSVRATINFGIAGVCMLTLLLLRTNISLKILPLIPVTLFGLYCIFLLNKGELYLWLAVWIFAYPPISIFLCQLLKGVIASTIGIVAASVLMYSPTLSPVVYNIDPLIKSRFIAGYMLIFILTIIFGYVSLLKDKKEEKLNAELAKERDSLKEEIDKATSAIKRHLEKANENARNLELLQQGMLAVMDAAPMICGVFDKDGNFITVNKYVETVYDIPDKQIYVDRFEEFLPPFQPDGQPSFQKSCDVIKKAFDEGEARYEWIYQKQDGTPIPTEEIGRRVRYGDRDAVVCYTRDLREFNKLKEAEQLVHERTQVLVQQLNGYVERQATAVSQSSAAIEEMISNTRSVTDTLAKNAKNVEQLKEVSDVGRAGLNEVAADIQEIARESESLLEINSVMQNIASQTNLLSMNAAIEAAHAGNVGKGFAVVADEIRKLAESSGNQSKTIGTVLKQIKSSIDKITRSTSNVLEKFEAIDSGVKMVADQEGMIFNAMEEQGRGSQQVLQGIAEVNEVTYQVKDTSRQLLEDSKVQ
jgi:PAS domain-containing protein